jgi:hypothetical protein
MIVNSNLIPALTSIDFQLVVGVEQEKVECEETPNGVITEFHVPRTTAPIYPARGKSLLPTKADITVYGLKGTTYTNIDAAVSGINATTDSVTGYSVYDEIEFTAAVSGSTYDKVCVTYIEELTPYIAQSIKADIKQDTKTYGELGSAIKHTSYGAQEITISQDNLMGDLDILARLLFDEYDGTGTEQSGYQAYTMISEPRDIYCYIPVVRGDDVVGRFYFRGRLVPKNLLDVKDGDNAGFALEISIEESPVMIVPEEA